jgi:hypothetical protein
MPSDAVVKERTVQEALRRMRRQGSTIIGFGGGGGIDITIVNTAILGAMTPTLIPDGETFTVPLNKQVLWNDPIDVEGILDVNGTLAYVT